MGLLETAGPFSFREKNTPLYEKTIKKGVFTMLTFITLVAAFVVAQILTAVIAFAVMRNKSFMKWFYKWVYDYMNMTAEVVEEIEAQQ